MALSLPERGRPARITIGDAFAYLVQQTIKPRSGIELAAAVHFASMRIFQRGTMTAAQAQSALPPLDFLDTDPIDIASAIFDAIVSKKLSVEGLPEPLLKEWTVRPVVHDWTSGLVSVSIVGTNRRFYPTLDRLEVDALFAIGLKDTAQSSSDVKAETMEVEPALRAGPVATAALVAFIRPVMASERLTEGAARDRATQHFAPKTFTDPRWREAWRDEPNKLKRGEKPSRKSGG